MASNPATVIPGCAVCGSPRHRQATLCRRCRLLRNRPERRKDWTKDGVARQEQMHRQWDKKIGAFGCAYTGLPLTTERDSDGRAGPLYATWEHRNPRSPSRASEVVLVGWLVDQRYEDGPDRARVQEDGQGARRALRGSKGESKGAAQPNGVAAGVGPGAAASRRRTRTERPSRASILVAASRCSSLTTS